MQSETGVFKFDADEISSRLPAAYFSSPSGRSDADDKQDGGEGLAGINSALTTLSILLADGSESSADCFLRSLRVLFAGPGEARRRLLRSDPLTILGNIRRWAIEGLSDESLRSTLEGPGRQGSSTGGSGTSCMRRTSWSVTARQARSVLANAFIGNCVDAMSAKKDPWNAGGLDFRNMLLRATHMPWDFMPEGSSPRRNGVGLSKMECLLVYFDACGSLEGGEDDERIITFDLIRFRPLSAADFMAAAANGRNCEPSSPSFVGEGIRIHTSTMESPSRRASAFVNFANANYGYGKFISSCTQEEILLMCCPELAVGMLFLGKMGNDEVVNVSGVRRYCVYSGYLDSFECTGAIDIKDAEGPPIVAVLTLDACYGNHFSESMLWRDVNKAFYSFLALAEQHRGTGRRPIVSTGKWGCGAFGGKPAHKFLQQAVAACAAGVDLEFSCFGSYEGCGQVLLALLETRPSVDAVVGLLRSCKDKKMFVSDAERFLREQALAHTMPSEAAAEPDNNSDADLSWP